MSTRTESLEAIARHKASLAAAEARTEQYLALRKKEEVNTAKQEITILMLEKYGVAPQFLDVEDVEVFRPFNDGYHRKYERTRKFWFYLDGYEFSGNLTATAAEIVGKPYKTTVQVSYRKWQDLSISDLQKVLEGKYSYTTRDRIRAFFWWF